MNRMSSLLGPMKMWLGEAVNYSSRDRQGVVIRNDLRPLPDGRSSKRHSLGAFAAPSASGAWERGDSFILALQQNLVSLCSPFRKKWHRRRAKAGTRPRTPDSQRRRSVWIIMECDDWSSLWFVGFFRRRQISNLKSRRWCFRKNGQCGLSLTKQRIRP